MADRTYAGGHVLQWHITHRCNLRCSHCYQADYGAQMGREALFAALDQYERYVRARALHAQINPTGGAPLRHPDFSSLAREIRRRDMDRGVLTNGTLIGEETAERLAELRPVFVQVSLDGCRRSHDAIRGPGAFRAALAGIDALKRQGVRVNVSFTAQRKNVRELPRLSRICRAHKVDKLWFDRVVIPREEDTERLSLSTEEFRALAETAARLRQKGLVACERALQFLPCADGSCYHCGAGGELLIFLADGGIMPCRRLPFVIGNLRDGELADILAGSERMRELREAPIPEACRSCAHADRCRGGAKCVTYARTGSFYGKDVNCWL